MVSTAFQEGDICGQTQHKIPNSKHFFLFVGMASVAGEPGTLRHKRVYIERGHVHRNVLCQTHCLRRSRILRSPYCTFNAMSLETTPDKLTAIRG